MEISSAIQIINTLVDFTKSVHAGNVDAAVRQKAAELTDSIIALQNSILSLQSESYELREVNRQLKEQLMQVTNWDNEADRYELQSLCDGVEVYALKIDKAGREPYHYICPNCYQKRRKSIIQRMSKESSGVVFKCQQQDCGSIFIDHTNCARFS